MDYKKKYMKYKLKYLNLKRLIKGGINMPDYDTYMPNYHTYSAYLDPKIAFNALGEVGNNIKEAGYNITQASGTALEVVGTTVGKMIPSNFTDNILSKIKNYNDYKIKKGMLIEQLNDQQKELIEKYEDELINTLNEFNDDIIKTTDYYDKIVNDYIKFLTNFYNTSNNFENIGVLDDSIRRTDPKKKFIKLKENKNSKKGYYKDLILYQTKTKRIIDEIFKKLVSVLQFPSLGHEIETSMLPKE